MSFNFTEEMVKGKKHMEILNNYDNNKYDFRPFAIECFKTGKLDMVHENNPSYEVFKEFGPDVQTWYHEKFYNYLKTNGGEMQERYDNLIKDIILPYLNLKEALVQKFPSFRIQLPGNKAVAKMHNDHTLGHPVGEINFSYSFTDMYDTNTIYIEEMPRSKIFKPMNMKANNNICFNANLCMHYNEINETGKSRMSMDYRILPLENLPKKDLYSHSTKQKFVEGGYYNLIKL
jgi:acetone carboxylase gamma subunit